MLKKIITTLLFICCSITINANASFANDTVELTNIMKTMSTLWNKGDIKAFVNYYKHSANTLYVSSHLVKGYEQIESEYLKRYPTKQVMGKLSTANLEIQFLTPDIAIMTAKWKLIQRNAAPKHGIVTLVWEKSNDGWKIILDH